RPDQTHTNEQGCQNGADPGHGKEKEQIPGQERVGPVEQYLEKEIVADIPYAKGNRESRGPLPEVSTDRQSHRSEHDQRSSFPYQFHDQESRGPRAGRLQLFKAQEREEVIFAAFRISVRVNRLVMRPQISHDGRLDKAEADTEEKQRDKQAPH